MEADIDVAAHGWDHLGGEEAGDRQLARRRGAADGHSKSIHLGDDYIEALAPGSDDRE